MHLQSYDCVLCNEASWGNGRASFLALQLCQRLLESGRYSSAYCSSTFGNPWEFQNTAWCIFLHMEIIVLMCWSVWTVRNNLIFRNEAVSLDRCKLCFLSVFGLVIPPVLSLKKKNWFSRLNQLTNDLADSINRPILILWIQSETQLWRAS